MAYVPLIGWITHKNRSSRFLTRKKTVRAVALLLLTGSLAHICRYVDDIVIADFESGTYGNWKVEGTAFGSEPAQGTLPNQMPVSGFKGKGLANSFKGSDGSTGKLTSPPFTIERNYINFIGGGKNPDHLGMRLLVGGQAVRSATGPNDRPSGSEALAWAYWDVTEFKGQSAVLEIFDSATGGWGHISVDNITQSDIPKQPVPAEQTFTATEPWLLLPVKNGAAKRTLTVSVGGKELRNFVIELSDGPPDWWAGLDLSRWQGQKVTLKTTVLSDESKALDQIQQVKELPGASTVYKESLRGQLRFSSRVGWLNDPNGMVYSQGQYHLFYQHNPYGWAWDNMHWGHAVSPDMVHWRELPVAIYPHAPGDDVYSGSAIVDKNNTSGWKQGDNDLMVAAYTSTGRGECITYSNDQGRNWTEFVGNPVIKHQGEGRDPRLLWHEPTRQWVMVVWSQDDSQPVPSNRGGIDFYTSPDLKKWTFQSRSGGWFECPDFFELPLENGQKKWVLTAASSEYRIGSFDGKTFVPETPKLPGMQGRDFYAAQTFSHEPKGRRIQIGWFRTETPGRPFNQAMSLPNELKLKTTPQGLRLTWTPALELESLHAKTHSLGAQTMFETGPDPLANLRGELFEIRAEFEPGTANEVKFNLRGIPVTYNASRGEIGVGNLHAPAPLQNGKQRLTIYIDRTGIEIYASDGLTFVPMPVNVKADDTALGLSVVGGTAKFSRLDVYELKSSWEK